MNTLSNSTLTLKGRPRVQSEKPAQLKGPKYYHQFMGDGLITVDMQSGRTWTGKLIALHIYELLLDESDHGEILVFKGGIESIRHANGGDACGGASGNRFATPDGSSKQEHKRE